MEGEDPEARKQRLKALKRAAQQAEGGQEPAEQPEEKPTLKLRNYKLRDKTIAHEQIEAAQPPKFEEPVIVKKPEDAEGEELLANVAPKKANWDLKRDIADRLDKLERRTQRAIVKIMQQQEAEEAAANS